MTKQTADAIAAQLIKRSDVLVAYTYEYPGYLAISTDGGGLWAIGTASGTFGADLYIDQQSMIDGESPDHAISTDIPEDSEDIDLIVERLYAAMIAI